MERCHNACEKYGKNAAPMCAANAPKPRGQIQRKRCQTHAGSEVGIDRRYFAAQSKRAQSAKLLAPIIYICRDFLLRLSRPLFDSIVNILRDAGGLYLSVAC